ncbi:uncharacterized protein [Nicotiana sylvestris]|uniref:uncharacterized protein n=1 Tax=Nicotiana sylvestris TaxID=4096 RepID=UPI00388C8146
MIISSWNIRGLNKRYKQNELKAFFLNLNITLLGCLETRINPRSVNKVKIKFSKDWKKHLVEAISNNKRIWLFWKESMVQVHIHLATPQMLHYQVKEKGSNFSGYITFVYGKNKINERRDLWEQLRQIHSNMQEAWLVIGDFNNVLSVHDQLNGQPMHQTELVEFEDCIRDIGLGQLNRKGCQWSWCNKKDVEDRIYRNIDWAFENASWLTHYK